MTRLKEIENLLKEYNKTDTARDRIYMRRLEAEKKGILEGIEMAEELSNDFFEKNIKAFLQTYPKEKSSSEISFKQVRDNTEWVLNDMKKGLLEEIKELKND